MKNQIIVLDYTFHAPSPTGWAKVSILGKEVEFSFTHYDFITEAIELGYLEQPEDRDKVRVGYEDMAFSAVVREAWPYEHRVVYRPNLHVINEFGQSEFSEQIVLNLALQAPEVQEVIQAEATSIACCDCPANITGYIELMEWFVRNGHEEFLCGLVNWDHVSQHKIASLRTENKLVEKLI